MLDDQLQDSSGNAAPANVPAGLQLSLKEIFFVTTWLAIQIGVYVHISPLLAFGLSGGILLLAAIRIGDIHHYLAGGSVGYLIVGLLAWLYVITNQRQDIEAMMLLIIVPALGFLAGAYLAEQQKEQGR